MSKGTPRKAGRNPDPPLTDRERILMTIISHLSGTQTLRGHRGMEGWTSDYYRTGPGADSYYVHFAPWQKPKPGDLVLATTGGVSPWKIGFYVEPMPDSFGGAVIREIGGNRLCNYGNEQFRPIVGLTAIDLLEGDQRKLYVKVLKAFHRGDEYLYRFGGIRFEDGHIVCVRVREAHGGDDSIPFEVSFLWSKRTSINAILKELRNSGYGTKSFRPAGWKPPVREPSEPAPSKP